MKHNHYLYSSVCIAALTLSACGGGGGGTPQNFAATGNVATTGNADAGSSESGFNLNTELETGGTGGSEQDGKSKTGSGKPKTGARVGDTGNSNNNVDTGNSNNNVDTGNSNNNVDTGNSNNNGDTGSDPIVFAANQSSSEADTIDSRFPEGGIMAFETSAVGLNVALSSSIVHDEIKKTNPTANLNLQQWSKSGGIKSFVIHVGNTENNALRHKKALSHGQPSHIKGRAGVNDISFNGDNYKYLVATRDDSNLKTHGGNTTAIKSGGPSYYIAGLETNPDVIRNKVEGSVHYSGKYYGTAVRNRKKYGDFDTTYHYNGNFGMSVDFAKGTLFGSFRPTDANGNVVNGALFSFEDDVRLGQNSFTAQLQNGNLGIDGSTANAASSTTGSITLKFYGYEANEVGGTFQATTNHGGRPATHVGVAFGKR